MESESAYTAPGDLDVDELDVDPPDWDEEACEEAEATAEEIAEHDPEAAAHLYAQLAAVRRVREREAAQIAAPHTGASRLLSHTATAASAPYDPMRLYAQLARYYHFGDREIDAMHFPRALAYYREAVLMQEEEASAQDAAMKRAQRNARRGQRGYGADDGLSEIAALASMPRPRAYTGPVARLVD